MLKSWLIAATDEGSPLVELFWGNGSGIFSETGDASFHFTPVGKSVVVGDFNGDGFDDAAVACQPSADVPMLLGGRHSIQTGTLPGGEHPWGLAALDLNGDANPSATVYISLDR